MFLFMNPPAWGMTLPFRLSISSIPPSLIVYQVMLILFSWYILTLSPAIVERIQMELSNLPELRRWSWKSRRAKATRIHRAEFWEEKRAAQGESSPEICRESPLSLQIILIRTWFEETTWDWVKCHWKRAKRVILRVPSPILSLEYQLQ